MTLLTTNNYYTAPFFPNYAHQFMPILYTVFLKELSSVLLMKSPIYLNKYNLTI